MDAMKNLKLSTLILAVLPLALLTSGCKEKSAPGSSGSGGTAGFSIPAQPPVPGDLVVTAELVDIAGQFPPNDLYNYAYVMKYRVIQVVQGTYADSVILVGQYNPRLAREEIKDEQDANVGGNVKSFQGGDVHYLVLKAMDGFFTGAVEENYFADKRPRYWALWTDKAK